LLKVQEYLQLATKHYDEKTDAILIKQIQLKLLGVCLITIGEEVGRKHIIRLIHHLLQYGDKNIKPIVPIMLTILGIHNFNIQTTDLLYKMAHSEDKETALRAILGLGLISAGSNNSRVSALLKNLGFYYSEENERDF